MEQTTLTTYKIIDMTNGVNMGTLESATLRGAKNKMTRLGFDSRFYCVIACGTVTYTA